MPWLINAEQANKFRKSQKSLLILDASYHLPQEERNARAEFLNKHLPGAHFFDITLFTDSNTHKLITDENKISELLGSMGIRNDYKIIFYDNSALHTACRAAWMMKYFGHNPRLLYVLDGGLTAWEKEIKKTEAGNTSLAPRKYQARLQVNSICNLARIKENLNSCQEQIVDVRHPVRYAGGAESRPGLRSGHIPNSISFPYTSFFTAEGKFQPLEKIRKLLASVAIDLNLPIIATCGSSVTATVLDVVLDILNHKQHCIYEGSWIEWGADTLYPGENSLDERPVITSVEHDEPPAIV